MAFPDYDYLTLEPLDVREFASADSRGFLAQHGGPVILDEVQRTPDLFSYLQEEVDRDSSPGRFVLTGSHHFGPSESLSQSLADRVARLHRGHSGNLHHFRENRGVELDRAGGSLWVARRA
jgi:hypothetical protein